MLKIAKDNLIVAKQRQSQYADQHRRELVFKVNDKVLLSTKHINDPVDKNRPTKKLAPKFIGPYKISKVISKVAYKLELPSTLRIHPVFHVSLLKPYQECEDFEREVPPPPIFIPEVQQEEYEVESILDKKIVRRRPFYLIKWLGYPLHEATWEPLAHLTNAKDLVDEFEQAN